MYNSVQLGTLTARKTEAQLQQASSCSNFKAIEKGDNVWLPEMENKHSGKAKGHHSFMVKTDCNVMILTNIILYYSNTKHY